MFSCCAEMNFLHSCNQDKKREAAVYTPIAGIREPLLKCISSSHASFITYTARNLLK
ncbi:MAG: hypothetical protein PARBA_01373 [Parabacteroides sp.]